MSVKTQDYKTHRRLVPGYHFVLSGIYAALIIISVIITVQQCGENCLTGVWLILASVALIVTGFFARSFAIKAQDRGIRAEENFRHFVLTGKPLPKELRLGQVIALRFASDEEFPALVTKAVAENIKPDDIKKLVKNWRGDFHRV
ncbi:MAG: DUF6526 family protein [Bacteroidia bacterium]